MILWVTCRVGRQHHCWGGWRQRSGWCRGMLSVWLHVERTIGGAWHQKTSFYSVMGTIVKHERCLDDVPTPQAYINPWGLKTKIPYLINEMRSQKNPCPRTLASRNLTNSSLSCPYHTLLPVPVLSSWSIRERGGGGSRLPSPLRRWACGKTDERNTILNTNIKMPFLKFISVFFF